MSRIYTTEFAPTAVLVICLGLLLASPELHGRPQHGALAPRGGPAMQQRVAPGYQHPIPGATGHLPEWLAQHQNLPVQQQEMLLRQDPSFQRLPASAQQRLLEQLARIHAMPPGRRARYLARNEAIERLNPAQRAAFTQSVRELNALPADRLPRVSQAFQTLRELPPDQRGPQLNAPLYTSSLSAQEREILGNLLAVEPYQPPTPAATRAVSSPSAPK